MKMEETELHKYGEVNGIASVDSWNLAYQTQI